MDADFLGGGMRNEEQRAYWDELAPEWIAAQHDLESVGGWFGDRAQEALAVDPGEYVVDIGCGTGESTVALAHRAGATGRAVGVDISTAMVAEAARRAASVDGVNVSFVVADAEEAPVADGADAVFSRFGVMFFADPERAFSNLLLSLRPGGRLAVVVWQQVFANEWMLLPGMAALTATGSLPPMPAEDEPGPFSLSDPDKLRRVLVSAGFTDVDVQPSQHALVVEREEVDGFVRRALAVGAAREAIRARGGDPAVAETIAAQLRQDLLDRIADAPSTSLSAAAWLATARRE